LFLLTGRCPALMLLHRWCRRRRCDELVYTFSKVQNFGKVSLSNTKIPFSGRKSSPQRRISHFNFNFPLFLSFLLKTGENSFLYEKIA